MKKRIIITVILLLLITIILVLYSRYIGTSGLKVKEYKVEVENLIQEYHGLKIVHLSDIHYGTTIKEQQLKKIVDEVNKLKPDLVFLTGDLFDESVNVSVKDYDNVVKELGDITSNIGNYAISGDNDNIEKWDDIISSGGFINLNNTYQLIYDNSEYPIIISGLSSSLKSTISVSDRIKPINDYIESLEQRPTYSILLMHEPDNVEQINTINYDLILAGHSMGGLIKLPFSNSLINLNGALKYTNDYYKINNTNMYISSGLGTSKIKYRFNNKPSINFYRITKK